LLYAAIAGAGWTKRKAGDSSGADRRFLAVIVAYFAVLVACVALFRPETHQSTSVHQTVGACYVEAADITGMTRFEFLCVTDFDEDFSFACLPSPPPSGARWYTVCGRPHTHFLRWLAAVLGLGVAGSL